jgi:hypothetical protein
MITAFITRDNFRHGPKYAVARLVLYYAVPASVVGRTVDYDVEAVKLNEPRLSNR